MITVYKYKLLNDNTVDLPEGAEILKADPLREELYIWAKVDTNKPLENRTFLGFGTGHRIDKKLNLVFINTCYLGSFVFHIFESVK